MSTNTYVALDSKTLGSSQASIVFTSIPQTYTDLFVVLQTKLASAGAGTIYLKFNTDTGVNTHYSSTFLGGTGSSALSSRSSNSNSIYASAYSAVDGTNFLTTEIHIMNYANTTTYKTTLSRGSQASYGTDAIVGNWRGSTGSSFDAINSITIVNDASINFAAGSTATIYGIANADVGAYATGGIITQDANYYYHAFGSSSTFTPTRNLTADILVVAGGGGGGSVNGGGGGAGGLLAYASQSLTSGTGYSCTVGAGGAGGAGGSGQVTNNGTQGGNSQFASLTASVGGGYGGANTNAGGSGGSGGGGASTITGAGQAGAGTSGQGSNGGTGSASPTYSGGGGGGAGGAGSNATSTAGGVYGIGSNAYSSWATATGTGINGYYASGGSGGSREGYTGGTVANGGGAGSASGSISGTAGVAFTGSGGGGGGLTLTPSSVTSAGGNGGSGLIIIRYSK
jgi:hypothetical protein